MAFRAPPLPLEILGQLVNKSGGTYEQNEDANHREIDLADVPTGLISNALA